MHFILVRIYSVIVISYLQVVICACSFHASVNKSVQCVNSLPEIQRNTLLPPIYHIDDYEACQRSNHLFCHIAVQLYPSADSDSPSDAWKLIKDFKSTREHYNHDELYHTICVQTACPHSTPTGDTNTSELIEKLSECYTEKYRHFGLTASVNKITFHNENGFPIRSVDVALLLVLVWYVLFVVFANVSYRWNRATNTAPTPFEQTWVNPFVAEWNWAKLRQTKSSEDFERLKCIQGIRFYNMLLIIFCHTVSTYMGGYTLNTEYFEDVHLNPVRLFIRNLLLLLVHIFFLLSGFFLSYHNFQLMESGEFRVRTMLLQFLNRYLRLVPPVLLILSLSTTVWITNGFQGPLKTLYADDEFRVCRKNWWATMLFINNHYNHKEMCCLVSWYLSADTQLYALSLVILSVVWKFRKFAKRIIYTSILVAVLIPMVVTYVYELDVIYRLTPENSKNDNFRSFAFNASYTSTYSNMATFMVGLGFGLYYYNNRTANNWRSLGCKVLFYGVFITVPAMAVVLTFFEYTRLETAILAGALKPIFAVGIAVGIYGMSNKLGGVVKRVCEWRFAVFMGNFTFSTYLAHYGIVFSRIPTTYQPRYVSDFVLGESFVHDIVLSYFCGIMMYLFIEAPMCQLQNKFIPQVRQRTKKT